MSYIPLTYAPLESSGKKEYHYKLPTGGVELTSGDDFVREGKAARLYNMDIKGEALETRCGTVKISENSAIEGQLHSISEELFFGNVIMHIGTSVYAYSETTNEIMVIGESVPDKKSIMCFFMSKVYIYCDCRVFSIDKDLKLAQELPDAPLLYSGVIPTTGMGTLLSDVPYNLCGPWIRVRFVRDYYNPSNIYTEFRLPCKADIGRKVFVYVNNEELNGSLYHVYEDRVDVNLKLNANTDTVEMVYFLKNPEDIGFEDVLSKCTFADSYGGNMNGGTRLYFAGNPDKTGYYFKSELQNPLCFLSDNFEIIGDGCEDITAMKKMYGDLIIFTRRTLYRMSSSLSSDGVTFPVREIGNGVGCDCPGSIRLIDNRVVFLNSEKGVFIVDSTESSGEQNVKPISGNVLLGKGEGITENERDLLINCCSIDFDRKYILFIGSKAYIWDYDKSAFHNSGNYSSSQSRLIWYMYGDVEAQKLFNMAGKLTAFRKSDYSFYAFDGHINEGENSGFSSGRIMIEGLFDKKQMTDMCMLMQSYGTGRILITFYADEKEYCQKSILLSEGEKKLIKLRLPSKTLYSFGFDADADTGVKIEDIFFKYRIV